MMKNPSTNRKYFTIYHTRSLISASNFPCLNSFSLKIALETASNIVLYEREEKQRAKTGIEEMTLFSLTDLHEGKWNLPKASEKTFFRCRHYAESVL
ncbi:MAG: hypothetical protein IPI25_09410 [Candidatus Brocadia sp.]|nr:MAG: hypothetical protein IPI25_09410 [Candidatus Brocadia sp.]